MKSMYGDYAFILNDLRQKLHDPRGPKAAVMVGSGFSRNAKPRFGGGRQFPLWKDLTRRLVDRLYNDPVERRKVLEAAGATSSALRLSEEFEAAFGRSALIEIVRQETSDDEFEPSDLHGKLVDLPWTDIFTTNFDRLIERAALTSPGRSLRRYSYEVVTQPTDITLARRPRIIKLHGTLPDLSNLVLTEEDFRCYGARNAAFVNAVRASMSENAFCLFGFSGDDPNFLAWSGWIRDTLREATPTVYLFCTSPLPPFKRKLLEQRNVVPIPLGTVFGTDDVGVAIGRLLDFLGEDPALATVNWNRPPDTVQLISSQCKNAEQFEVSKLGWIATALIWRRNRLDYQGWEILHRHSLAWLWGHTEFAIRDYTATKIGKLNLVEKLLVTRELLWRLSRCLVPIYDNLVEEIIDPLLCELETAEREVFRETTFCFDKEETTLFSDELYEAYRFIVCQLVRHAREIGDKERFRRLSQLLRSISGVSREEICFVEHQSLLYNISSLDAESTRKNIRDWDLVGMPAIWMVRRCGLLMEIGDVKLARAELLGLVDSLVSTKIDQSIDYQRHSVEALALYQLELTNWWLKNSRDSLDHVASEVECAGESTMTETTPTIGEEASLKNPHTSKKGMNSIEDNEEKSKPEIVEIRLTRRLCELNRIGCDPKELLSQFDDLFKHFAIEESERDQARSDNFDIGYTSRHYRSNDSKQLRNSYRVIRFVEDSGLPILIDAECQMNTAAMPPFLAASRVIARASCREALGPVLRSRDGNLAKIWLDRLTLSKMHNDQIEEVLRQTRKSFDLCIARLKKKNRMD